MDQVLLVFTNVPDRESAETIAQHVVQQKLAACVNCLPGVKSTYRWQGTVEQAEEFGLTIKTTQSRYVELERALVSLHPYDVPEIVAVPVTQGLPAYLEWVHTETLEKP